MILVTGATGTIGSATVEALKKSGAGFKVGSRTPEKAGAATGVDAVAFDWERPDTIAKALEGVERAFLLTPVTDQIEGLTAGFAGAAKSAGVKRVVKLSAIGASPESPLILGRQHAASEKALVDAGLDTTMIQPTFFAQNFVNYYGAGAKLHRDR